MDLHGIARTKVEWERWNRDRRESRKRKLFGQEAHTRMSTDYLRDNVETHPSQS